MILQDWGSLAASVAIVVALVAVQAAQGGPRTRPFLVTDATIAYPYLPSTIPYWLAILVCVLAVLASVLLAELALARRWHADATDAAAAALHFCLDAIGEGRGWLGRVQGRHARRCWRPIALPGCLLVFPTVPLCGPPLTPSQPPSSSPA